jgi:putative FmdB family regulatory protein
MPTYEYRCKDCGHEFVETLTVEQHDKRKRQCPKCKSKNVEQLLSSFYTKTASKT